MRKLFGIAASAALLVATTATAAPVVRSADVFLGISIQNVGQVSFGGPASVTVDNAAQTIQLAAGAISLKTQIIIPVTTTTAIAQISATTLSNQAGTFSFGGAGVGIPGTEAPCPPGGGGIACVNQTAFGGVMGLSGTINVGILPPVVVVPIDLNAGLIGQGGATMQPNTPNGFLFDAAPWTNAAGSVGVPTTTTTTVFVAGQTFSMTNMTTSFVPTSGTINPALSQLTLVTPTFVNALGNNLPVFANLTIRFSDGGGLPPFLVPEPSTLLLFGAGTLGLWLAGRRRQ